MWFVQPLLWWKFRELGEPLFTDLDHSGFLSSKTTSPRRRWLMTFKISFLGFRVSLGAKAIGFWSNMKTFCHLTHSNVHAYTCSAAVLWSMAFLFTNLLPINYRKNFLDKIAHLRENFFLDHANSLDVYRDNCGLNNSYNGNYSFAIYL